MSSRDQAAKENYLALINKRPDCIDELQRMHSTICQIIVEGYNDTSTRELLRYLSKLYYKNLITDQRSDCIKVQDVDSFPCLSFRWPLSRLNNSEIHHWHSWTSGIRLLVEINYILIKDFGHISQGASIISDQLLCKKLVKYGISQIDLRIDSESDMNIGDFCEALINTAIASRDQDIFFEAKDFVQDILININLKTCTYFGILELLERRKRSGERIYKNKELKLQELERSVLYQELNEDFIEALLQVVKSDITYDHNLVHGTINHIIEMKKKGIFEGNIDQLIDLKLDSDIADYRHRSNSPSLTQSDNLCLCVFPDTGKIKKSYLNIGTYSLTSSQNMIYVASYEGQLYRIMDEEIKCIGEDLDPALLLGSHDIVALNNGRIISANFRKETIATIDFDGKSNILKSDIMPIAITEHRGRILIIDYLTGGLRSINNDSMDSVELFSNHTGNIFYHSLCSIEESLFILSKGYKGQFVHIYNENSYRSIPLEFNGGHDWFSISMINKNIMLLSDYNSGVYTLDLRNNALTQLFTAIDCTNALFNAGKVYATSERINGVYIYEAGGTY